MSRSDREQRDAERAARRARRLAERAEQRAKRKTEQAERAADRADKLAERARRKPIRDDDRSFEDFVDEFAEKWERKAESWFEDKGKKYFEEDARFEDDLDDGHYTAEEEARRARDQAARAKKVADEAESRARRANSNADSDRRRSRRSRRTSRSRYRRRSFRSRLNSGRSLYRDKSRAKVSGVCAGLADYLEVDTWQVRLVAAMGLIFIPTVAVPVYFIMYFLMDDKPYYRQVTDRFEEIVPDDDDEEVEPTVKSYDRKQRKSESPRPKMSNTEAFRTAKEKFSDIEERLRSMESHVTSSRFELQRELRKISGDDA